MLRRFLSLILCAVLSAAYFLISIPPASAKQIPHSYFPALSVSVEYDDLKPPEEHTGRLDPERTGEILISCSAEGETNAAGVTVTLEPGNGLVVDGPLSFSYTFIPRGMTMRQPIRLSYDESLAGQAGEGGDPVPTLDITVDTQNIGSASYHCEYDVTPKARAVVYCGELASSSADTVAVNKKSYNYMTDFFRKAYYDGKRIEVSSMYMGPTFSDFIDSAIGKPDANDITYIYITGHGRFSDHSFVSYERGEKSNTLLIDFLNDLADKEGRFAIILDVCFSGYATDLSGLDPHRYSIIALADSDVFVTGGQFTDDVKRYLGETSASGDEEITFGELFNYISSVSFQRIENSKDMFIRLLEATIDLQSNKITQDDYIEIIAQLLIESARLDLQVKADAVKGALPEFARKYIDGGYNKIEDFEYDAARTYLGSVSASGSLDEFPFLVSSPEIAAKYRPLGIKSEQSKDNLTALSGYVYDEETLQRLDGVKIEVRPSSAEVVLTAETNGSGVWVLGFCRIPASISFSRDGYEDRTVYIDEDSFRYGAPVEVYSVGLKKNALSFANQRYVTAGTAYVAALLDDGTVIASEDDFGVVTDTSGWSDIVSISSSDFVLYGLKSDGTVVANTNTPGVPPEPEVFGWNDIVQLSADSSGVAGLKSNGTVVVTSGHAPYHTTPEYVADWRDIVYVTRSHHFIFGLKSDGTVILAGDDPIGNPGQYIDVSGWRDIVGIAAGRNHLVGLKSDGTVIAASYSGFESAIAGVSGWTDIVQVDAGLHNTFGVRADGTVLMAGKLYLGEADVSGWRGVIQVAADSSHAIGLKQDGTVHYTGLYGNPNAVITTPFSWSGIRTGEDDSQ